MEFQDIMCFIGLHSWDKWSYYTLNEQEHCCTHCGICKRRRIK
jgi:hypothetical protein